ncbi:damage-control phosphatase ARMT1 family protein [Tichowtungia aerotolerans]|uniref:DUF89 family protein n=1 Tax=Tichowtungia aerotolerans TaxID=2697043 RepID=A0A6P1M3N7_9BACT|nr:ARMT1-like domain-containing protein [Tichowtungia aerotolerans]QHI69459.1 DUF89 family protein [Tichowtungia aerotolerans]
MKTCLDCLPCFVRQILDAGRLISEDPAVHEEILRESLQDLANENWNNTPPVIAQRLHKKLKTKTGINDLYRDQKKAHNELALHLLPKLRADVSTSDDPLTSAAHFAIAGNIIDLGAKNGLSENEVLSAVEHASEEPLEGDLDAFRTAVENAESILYLGDNAGEIVFDRLLIEQLGPERVTLAVRGAPILNDALEEDARLAGLHDLVPIIGNGNDVPGTDLEQCNDKFRALFNSADLVISKGQGNFETLNENPRQIFFLFKVKCPMVANASGQPLGTHVLMEKAKQ